MTTKGSMAQFVDTQLLQGVTWELLEKHASAEAQKRGTAMLSTIGMLRSHVKFRAKSPKWDVEITDVGVRMNAVAQTKSKPAATKTGKPVGRKVTKKTENGRQTVIEPVTEPESPSGMSLSLAVPKGTSLTIQDGSFWGYDVQ
jgi:hypothetical protein